MLREGEECNCDSKGEESSSHYFTFVTRKMWAGMAVGLRAT